MHVSLQVDEVLWSEHTCVASPQIESQIMTAPGSPPVSPPSHSRLSQG